MRVTDLRRTGLYERHLAAGAKMADFGGWSMPIEYVGVVAEHTAVRSAVGVFDVSHMGKVRVHGAGALEALNGVLTNDLRRIGDGQAQYTLLCRADGGVIDDMIVYRWRADELFIVPNAANTAAVVDVLSEAVAAASAGAVVVDDLSQAHGIIAVQGPRSADLLASMGLPVDHAYMSMVATTFRDAPVIVCRSGYTGELGYELVVPSEILVETWDALIARRAEFGLERAGLGARDTLRTEMGYPLHGQDIGIRVTPVQAGLGWAVGWDKPEFAGRAALAAERGRPPRRLRGIVSLDRAIPRPHMSAWTVGAGEATGALIGEVTSGTFSPTLRQGIGLALLDSAIGIDEEILIDVRGRPHRFRVATPPFVVASPKGDA